jgi:hypothetical protein
MITAGSGLQVAVLILATLSAQYLSLQCYAYHHCQFSGELAVILFFHFVI